MYCLRARDNSLIVARAAKTSQSPGQWYKYYSGSWLQPGLGGLSTPLQYVSSSGNSNIHFGSASVSTWTGTGYTMLINNDGPSSGKGGVTIAFSNDNINFTKLGQPILITDGNQWSRTSTSPELMVYPAAISGTGGRTWGDHFTLTYTDLQPGANFSQRYLVQRQAYVWVGSQQSSGNIPQVGIELSRWLATGSTPQEIWTTTAPVPGNFSTFGYEGGLGYVMTSALTGPYAPTTRALEECLSNWPGNPDHLVDIDGNCISAGYQRLRTIGWVYVSSQPNTVALYRCWSPTVYKSHFVSNASDCEGKGNMESILGYALAE